MQRVSKAAVTVDGVEAGRIAGGLLILLGVGAGDSAAEVKKVAGKCVNLRIFEDDTGKMNWSLLDVGGEALIVSQFTLYGDTRKGRRPGYDAAARPELAEKLYENFIREVRGHGVNVAVGRFGAMMELEIHNQGPVTLMIEA